MKWPSILNKARGWMEYEFLLMGLGAIVVTLLSILLAACTAPNRLSNIYLLSLEYSNGSTSTTADPAQIDPAIAAGVSNVSQAASGRLIQVRAGYRGLCMIPNDGDRVCSSNAGTLVDILKTQRAAAEYEARETNKSSSSIGTRDPIDLIWHADSFRRTVVFDGLIFITIALSTLVILLVLTFPRWHEEVDELGEPREIKPLPARRFLVSTMLAAALGFMLILISGLWQQINSSATVSLARTFTYGAVEGHLGIAAMALVWAAVGLQGILAVLLLLWVMKLKWLSLVIDNQ